MKASIALLAAVLLLPMEVEPQSVLRRRLTQKGTGIAKGGAAAQTRETGTPVAAIVAAPTNSPVERPARLPLFGKSGAVFKAKTKTANPKAVKLEPAPSGPVASPGNQPLKGFSVQKGKSGKMTKARGEKKNSKAAKSVVAPILPVAIDVIDDNLLSSLSISMPMSMPDDDFSWELLYEDGYFSVSMSLPNPFEDEFPIRFLF